MPTSIDGIAKGKAKGKARDKKGTGKGRGAACPTHQAGNNSAKKCLYWDKVGRINSERSKKNMDDEARRSDAASWSKGGNGKGCQNAPFEDPMPICASGPEDGRLQKT